MRYALVIVSVLSLGFTSTHCLAQTTQPTHIARPAPSPYSIDFKNTPLVDAFDFLRRVTNINFIVDWKALEDVGVSKDTPVTLQLGRVKARIALRATLENAAPKLLSYYADQGVIHISTQAEADTHMTVKVFPVQDLIVDIPNFKSNQSNNSNDASTEVSVGGNDTGSSGSTGSSGFGNSNDNTDDTQTKTTSKERANDLISLIQTTVRPEIWDVNGGKATIKFYNGSLVISAPLSVLEKLGTGY